MRFNLPEYMRESLQRMSPFRRQVMMTLLSVEKGTCLTYSELAKKAGFPKAVRAVGTVMANNPFPIVFPCHRIIKKSGESGQYALGVEVKDWLLKKEGVL